MQNLQSLSIYSKIHEDQFDSIINLNRLTSLYIFNNDINLENLEKISTMQNIKYLEISLCHITDITCIGNMIQLEYLDISMNNISNIDSLKNLYNLKKVILYDNNINDFTAVAHVNNVIYEEQ